MENRVFCIRTKRKKYKEKREEETCTTPKGEFCIPIRVNKFLKFISMVELINNKYTFRWEWQVYHQGPLHNNNYIKLQP